MLAVTGRLLITASASAGRALALLGHTLGHLPALPRSARQLLYQIDHAGFGSILVLSLITGLTGMIMAMQMGSVMEQYGALDTMGVFIGLTFCRELGPIWAAVIVLARVGSAMAAELGTMVVNEEVEALRVMSIDPYRYLVLPRLTSLVLAMPLLVAIGDVVGLVGGALVGYANFDLAFDTYWTSASNGVETADFLSGLVKGTVFGVIIAVIACDQGLNAGGGAEGVGKATTRSVMLNVVFVLIADFLLTDLFRRIGWGAGI